MAQNINIYSVTDITAYIKRLIANDFMCSAVSVDGELSNVKYHSSGHIYFTLKDTGAALSCVMFSSSAKGLSFRLKDGDKIIVSGRIDVYEQQGKYQLYVRTARQAGLGELYAEYERIKAELEAMGMFDATYKRKVPRLVKTLGVVTSETGAVRRDIENVTRRRNPYVQILLYPVQVQGDGAKESIANGLRAIAAYHPDVIIVGRGGGSMEDLWAFNSIEVAQAVFESQIPVISAVGHETDFTIADFVADLRAPTPSAAAELAVFDLGDLKEKTGTYYMTFSNSMRSRIRNDRNRLENLALRLKSKSPSARMNERRLRLDGYYDGIINAMSRKLIRYSSRLDLYREKLKGADPQGRLKNGYAFVEGADGKPVKDVTKLHEGDTLKLIMNNGKVYTDVRKIEEKKA